jgi:hypothetical protein
VTTGNIAGHFKPGFEGREENTEEKEKEWQAQMERELPQLKTQVWPENDPGELPTTPSPPAWIIELLKLRVVCTDRQDRTRSIEKANAG